MDAGEVTAEYACGVTAVVSMAATLYTVVTSPGMWDLVTRPIRVALSMLL